MKIVCPKKIVSNIPVLASVCFTRPVYLTQYSASQELFIKFMTRWYRKYYNIGSSPKILRQMNVNEGNFILTWYLDGIFFKISSAVEKYEDNFMLTWNSGK
jgi:hypothetical protein